MKRKFMLPMILALIFGINTSASGTAEKSAATGQSTASARRIIADHTRIDLDRIPLEWAKKAKNDLHIAYGHSSHGSQITYGMMGLTFFKKDPFIFEKGAPEGSIDLRDNPFGGEKDLGNPDNKTWAVETRKYLNQNKEVNVVIWSWCGQLSEADDAYVKNYLDLMQSLEKEFPTVTFVYMTGHLDGTGLEGTLAKRNQQIRDFCISKDKVLFDFADIESYDPDGRFFGDRYANDACIYDSNGDKVPDKNWAQEWQSSHREDKEWYGCYAAHTESVNANMKAYAMWWLLSRIAGWSGDSGADPVKEQKKGYDFYANKLNSINLFKGTDQGYDLDRVPTRLEGAAMLTRLLGGEKDALSKRYPHPFEDAENTWGTPYVGYLHHYDLTKGISENEFGCSLQLESSAYVTFLLRALGYSDHLNNGDFQWNKALEKAKELGMIDQEYYVLLKKEGFNRGHMAKLTVLSLTQKLNKGSMTLLEKLVKENAIDKNAAERF